jgi:conjugative coupling factor TraD (TOL family)
MSYPVESLLRPPVELISAGVFAACAASCYGASEYLMMTPAISVASAVGFCAAAVWRARQARHVIRYHQNLRKLPIYELMPDQIPASPTRLFLGQGFRWTDVHTQRLHETRLSKNAKYLRQSLAYRYARRLQYHFEEKRSAARLVALLKQRSFGFIENPVAPLPPVGGTPSIHGVEPDEGPITSDLAERVGHTLVLGTTRVGKTRLCETLIAQDIRNGACVFTFDPKGDAGLLTRMYVEALRCGREKDFVFFHLGYPDLSAMYNPVGQFSRITEVATRIANQLPSEGQSAAFKEFVWRFVNVMTRAMVALGQRPSYQALYGNAVHVDGLAKAYYRYWLDRDHPEWVNYINSGDEDSIKELNAAAKKTGRDKEALSFLAIARDQGWHDPIADGIASVLANDRSYFEKLVSSLYPLLEKVTTGLIADLLSPEEFANPSDTRRRFDWMSAINQNKIVYIGLDSLSDFEVAAAVGNAMFADLTSTAGQLYKFGQGFGQRQAPKKNRICIHADEFNELVGDEFIPMVNKAGGAGYEVTAYTQTWSDVEAKIGSKAKAAQIQGNFNTLIMLRVKNTETAQILTDQLPEVDIWSTVVDSGASDTNDPRDFAEFGSSNKDRLAPTKVPMLAPVDLVQLPKGQAFALIEGGQLVKIRLPLFSAKADKELPADLASIAHSMRAKYANFAANDDELLVTGTGSGF